MVETHKQFISIILDSASPTQNSVIKQEERIPERQKTTLVGIKVKIKQTPRNVVTTKKTYCTEPEVLREKLRNESAF